MTADPVFTRIRAACSGFSTVDVDEHARNVVGVVRAARFEARRVAIIVKRRRRAAA